MRDIGNYACEVTTARSFEDALARATELLGEQGFGVVSEIDLHATFQKKLGIDWKPFKILGACHPGFAHRVLAAVPEVAVLLPCNVVVWDEGDRRVVAAMEPRVMGQVVEHPEVRAVADEVSERLRRVLAAIG